MLKCGRAVAFLSVAALTCQLYGQETITLPGAENRAPTENSSYALGWNIGSSLASDGFDDKLLDLQQFVAGVSDALKRNECKLDDGKMQEALTVLQTRLQESMMARFAANAAASKKFLEENAKAEGVIVLPSGLQYQVLKAGTGAQPKLSSTVKVNYHGTLIDGRVFDSSVDRGEPVEFPVGRVIKGWTEALQRMKVGDKWKLFIPSELAYGENAPPGSIIEPNSALVFEVELLEVK